MFASYSVHYMGKKALNICSNLIKMLFTTMRMICLCGSNRPSIIIAVAIFYVS